MGIEVIMGKETKDRDLVLRCNRLNHDIKTLQNEIQENINDALELLKRVSTRTGSKYW